MSADFIFTLPEKGSRLLSIIVAEIKTGRIEKRNPETFISYSEALQKLGIPLRGRRAGQLLQREGLTELNEWTRNRPEIPKVAGLIVDKNRHRPSEGFAKSYGREHSDWQEWWLTETDKAIEFDWSPYIQKSETDRTPESRVQDTPDQLQGSDYRGVITIEVGKRGGRPCIRGMRITVADVLGWLAAGMSQSEIVDDFPELTPKDIQAALAFAADRERRAISLGDRHEITL